MCPYVWKPCLYNDRLCESEFVPDMRVKQKGEKKKV